MWLQSVAGRFVAAETAVGVGVWSPDSIVFSRGGPVGKSVVLAVGNRISGVEGMTCAA